VLTADEARVLENLTVGGSVAATASAAGLRRARSRGVGVEFHEYRHYQPGDDPRAIDWTVEARLKQLVVRVSRAEGDLRLHVLLDVSRSMSLGMPSKLSCAAKLAAALSYVAVERRDLAGLATFDDTVRTFLPPTTGRAQLFRVLSVLQNTVAGGSSAIDDALFHYGAAVRGPGLAAVVSDFFAPGAGLQGLRFLLHRGLTPAVVQVIAREELDPRFEDDVEMIDVERPGERLVVTASLIDAYRARLAQHVESLKTFCLNHQLPWIQVESGTTFKAMVGQLQTSGLFSPVV
jgi:uncharacterized protein (DUF58 family)